MCSQKDQQPSRCSAACGSAALLVLCGSACLLVARVFQQACSADWQVQITSAGSAASRPCKQKQC